MREEQNSTGRVYDALPVRHWDTYEDGRRNHIFVMPLATGIPVDMMGGMDTDCPSKPFGGSGEYTFTPDSEGIVLSAGDTGPEEMWTTGHRLWLTRVSGMGRPVSLTPARRGGITSPVFSPDGSTLAYLAQTVPGYESDRYHILLRSWPGGRTARLRQCGTGPLRLLHGPLTRRACTSRRWIPELPACSPSIRLPERKGSWPEREPSLP